MLRHRCRSSRMADRITHDDLLNGIFLDYGPNVFNIFANGRPLQGGESLCGDTQRIGNSQADASESKVNCQDSSGQISFQQGGDISGGLLSRCPVRRYLLLSYTAVSSASSLWQ